MKLTYSINKSPEFIFDYLTDMQKFVSIHPVIYKIENKGDNNYKVFERLKFLFIPVSFTYPASIESDLAQNKVIIRAIVKKMTKVEIIFMIKSDNDKSIIDEEINFKSILPIKFMMKSIFKKQHEQLFKNLSEKNN